MKYSAPIKKIMERELARIEGRGQDGPTRVIGEIGRLHSAVQSLEAVALNRNPADNDALHMKKTHDAGVRLAKAVKATRQRANEILNAHNERLSEKLMERTGLRPPENLEGIMRHSEFRAAVRSFDAKDRRDILREAVKAKDTEALGALFNASPLVTGIDPNFVKEMRGVYEQSVAPEVIAEMNQLLEADGALQAVARSAEKVATDSQDERAVEAFIRAQQAAEQANESFTSAMQE
ncbi:hypothetical protein [Sediminimonas sp.]|uniref:hypothetical protein n=1 Tax=Sediminimonas sp. TaxID=2823379 RepID=UPI0025EED601|nr:hypothetical protein [Sediminimonas sp.]